VTRIAAPEATRTVAAGLCAAIDPRGATDAAVPATTSTRPLCASRAVADATVRPMRRGTDRVDVAAGFETCFAWVVFDVVGRRIVEVDPVRV
jgi:hypothetical protein